MASSTKGAKNQPHFAESDAPDIAGNPTEVSDYAALVGNRKADLSTVRTGLTGADVWAGLGFGETDTGAEYVYSTGSGWTLVRQPLTAWTPTIGNVATSAVIAKYSILNGRVTCAVKITISAAPSSAPTITLPQSADTTWSLVGSAVMKHGSSFTGDSFVLLNSATSVVIYPKFTSGSPAYVQAGLTVNSTLPITWAAGDIIEAQFSYLLP